MIVKPSNIRHLFVAGQLAKVYKLFLKSDFDESEFIWILGTLCFLGKWDEALLICKRRKLDSAAYFYLITLAVRRGDYHHTVKWFRELRKANNKFFYYQALAFYAFYKCRYKNCLTIVKRSRDLSLNLSESFYRILALDLLGHTFVQMGDVHKGIMHLEDASELSAILGNKTFYQATKVSILNYQAQFTETPELLIRTIEKKLKTFSRNDNYSEGALLLSLVHLQLLTGEMHAADKSLLKAQKIIFAMSADRHKSQWFFERAYYYYLSGHNDLAINFLQEAQLLVNNENEKKHLLKIIGLRRKIIRQENKDTSDLDKNLLQLTMQVGDPKSINMLARMGLIGFEISEDPLQKLFDELKVSQIIESSYYGLLREKLTDKKKSYLVTGLWKRGLLIIHPSGLEIKKSGVSELLLKTLILLAGHKSVSKETIVSEIWGFSYDPIRHDTAVYSLIHRLRILLGPLQKDLIGENHSYQFAHDFSHLDLSDDRNPPAKLTILQSHFKKGFAWNIRQHKALALMQNGQTFKVSEYAEKFQVSVITALRDLTELKNEKQIDVYGRARATTYGLLSHEEV